MNEKINKIQNQIIEEFSDLDDWLDKYEYLIELGKSLEPLDNKLKSDENSIGGCQSKVWLKTVIKDEKIYYLADSDSLITKGIIYLLLRVLNNQHPRDIANADLYFLNKIGLHSNLSPSRVNGLMSILNKITSSAKMIAGRNDN
jgi:cysteine desulfuration protein SufE